MRGTNTEMLQTFREPWSDPRSRARSRPTTLHLAPQSARAIPGNDTRSSSGWDAVKTSPTAARSSTSATSRRDRATASAVPRRGRPRGYQLRCAKDQGGRDTSTAIFPLKLEKRQVRRFQETGTRNRRRDDLRTARGRSAMAEIGARRQVAVVTGGGSGIGAATARRSRVRLPRGIGCDLGREREARLGAEPRGAATRSRSRSIRATTNRGGV